MAQNRRESLQRQKLGESPYVWQPCCKPISLYLSIATSEVRWTAKRKMANYTNFIIGALAVMSFVLLIKYRNLTQQMSEENISHRYSKKSLQDELVSEVSRKKEAQEKLQKSVVEVRDLKFKLKSSNARIEELKHEVTSKTEAVTNLSDEKEEFQKLVIGLEDDLKKTKALSDDTTETLKGVQAQQETLINNNQRLQNQVKDLRSVQARKNDLEKQLQESQGQVEELQKQLQEKTKQLEDVQARLKETGTPTVQQAAGDKNKDANKTTNDGKGKRSVTLAKDNEIGDAEIAGEDVTKLSDNFEDYDMLEEDVKEKLKKEIQANESAAAEANDETGERKERQAIDGSAKIADKVTDDIGREGQNDKILESGAENQGSNDDMKVKGPQPSFASTITREEGDINSVSLQKIDATGSQNPAGSFHPVASPGSSS